MVRLTLEFRGFNIIGNDGEAFEFVVYKGFLLAKKEIWFASAKTTDFIIPHPISKEPINFSQWLVILRNRGVKIKFLLAPNQENKPLYQKLKSEANIEFRFCYDMHMKLILVDGGWLYFGSANLTGAGLGSRKRDGRNNFEIGTITIDKQVIQNVEKLIKEIWEGEHCRNCYQKEKGYCKGI